MSMIAKVINFFHKKNYILSSNKFVFNYKNIFIIFYNLLIKNKTKKTINFYYQFLILT